MSALTALLVRDMRLAVRVGGGAFMGVLFFLMVVVMVPFAVGPEPALLQRIAPAILWLGALLASLLTLDRLLVSDQEDGSLDLIVMGRMPLELAVAVKALAHWLTTGLPLVIAAPVLGMMLNLNLRASFGVAASNDAVSGAMFGTTFTILCGLSLANVVIGPAAAALALRHAE
jgi:heme exporter protein B